MRRPSHSAVMGSWVKFKILGVEVPRSELFSSSDAIFGSLFPLQEVKNKFYTYKIVWDLQVSENKYSMERARFVVDLSLN